MFNTFVPRKAILKKFIRVAPHGAMLFYAIVQQTGRPMVPKTFLYALTTH
jgi:hypothetical protein